MKMTTENKGKSWIISLITRDWKPVLILDVIMFTKTANKNIWLLLLSNSFNYTTISRSLYNKSFSFTNQPLINNGFNQNKKKMKLMSECFWDEMWVTRNTQSDHKTSTFDVYRVKTTQSIFSVTIEP